VGIPPTQFPPKARTNPSTTQGSAAAASAAASGPPPSLPQTGSLSNGSEPTSPSAGRGLDKRILGTVATLEVQINELLRAPARKCGHAPEITQLTADANRLAREKEDLVAQVGDRDATIAQLKRQLEDDGTEAKAKMEEAVNKAKADSHGELQKYKAEVVSLRAELERAHKKKKLDETGRAG
jgi:hypothetical protein